MQSVNICLDANVVLEIVLARKREATAREVLKRHAGNLYISALSAHLVMHFGVERASLSDIRVLLQDYLVLPLDSEDFEWAFAHAQDDDFEDALQLAVAVRHGCQTFLTFDQKLVKTYHNLPSLRVKLAG